MRSLWAFEECLSGIGSAVYPANCAVKGQSTGGFLFWKREDTADTLFVGRLTRNVPTRNARERGRFQMQRARHVATSHALLVGQRTHCLRKQFRILDRRLARLFLPPASNADLLV